MGRQLLVRAPILLAALVFLAARQGPFWITTQEQAQLVERLRAALPPGSAATGVTVGSIPSGWHASDTRTFEVAARVRNQTFRAWFVPRDWIGIRELDPTEGRVYWEGVLTDGTYKAITPDGPFPPYEQLQSVPAFVALSALGMNSASLVNSGWRTGVAVFGDRLDIVDRQTQDLVRRFCSARECIDEAARSLIVLGVPARTLTLDCAEHGSGRPQEFCLSVLTYWRLSESLPILRAVVSSSSSSSRARESAAFALGRIPDPSAGPALTLGLKATPFSEALTARAITAAIGRIRYAPAGPHVLAHLERERECWAKRIYYETLAALRYVPAVSAIDTTCEGGAGAVEQISAEWGQPYAGIRLRIVVPDSADGGPSRARGLIENVSGTDLEELRFEAGVWIVDEREYPDVDSRMWDGNPTLYDNRVDVRSVDLSKVPALSVSGMHTVRYRLRGAMSNVVTVRIQ